jgi:hypothetical protein
MAFDEIPTGTIPKLDKVDLLFIFILTLMTVFTIISDLYDEANFKVKTNLIKSISDVYFMVYLGCFTLKLDYILLFGLSAPNEYVPEYHHAHSRSFGGETRSSVILLDNDLIVLTGLISAMSSLFIAGNSRKLISFLFAEQQVGEK